MGSSTTYETDLKLTLGLPGTESWESQVSSVTKGNKRALTDIGDEARSKATDAGKNDAAPATKAQVVGWPPIRSYRKNSLQAKKTETVEAAGIYVKVSMDGAPYLRKIDLKVYSGYQELLKALGEMFKCFSLGDFSDKQGYTSSEFVLTYEDKDGDWMLVGDVPWEMFTSSCKRLRIMKGSDARGLGSGL